MNADELVEQYILERFRWDHPEHQACEALHAIQADAEDETTGPPSWCESVKFTAIIACGGPCEAPAPRHYIYGESGNLARIIEALEREQAGIEAARESGS